MKLITTAILAGSALALVGCGPAGREDGDGDGDGDGNMNTPDAGPTGEARKCSKMDIVFVVDDSGSMAEEQGNLAHNFPMFADVLQNYVNEDGEHIDFRVAVTTTGRDLTYSNSFGSMFPPMSFSEMGDDGAFRNNCNVNRRWLEPSDPDLGTALSCRASVGTGGPGYEMPLLMTKWALGDRVADNTNAGFLRDDALLGIVMLTDEDDSSSTQNNFTIDASNPNSGPVVDFEPADAIQFLDGVKGHRSRWAAGVIAGQTSCSSGFGEAAEATRLKQFVQMTNASGPQQAVFSSICDGNLTGALNDIIAKFQSACGGIIL
ncbi:MAG: putative lipoprotein [Myxococcales bacterium]|nr:putative lipoprotein [Myxococcales bacterium]